MRNRGRELSGYLLAVCTCVAWTSGNAFVISGQLIFFAHISDTPRSYVLADNRQKSGKGLPSLLVLIQDTI